MTTNDPQRHSMPMRNINMLDRRLPFQYVFESLMPLSPPLSETFDKEKVAKKLSDRAEFVVCMDGDDLLGFTAYYLNSAAHQIYVTLICVDSRYQAHGIGGRMLEHIAARAKAMDESYSTIALEANKQNGKAYRFYKKQEFIEQEDRGERLLMVKEL